MSLIDSQLLVLKRDHNTNSHLLTNSLIPGLALFITHSKPLDRQDVFYGSSVCLQPTSGNAQRIYLQTQGHFEERPSCAGVPGTTVSPRVHLSLPLRPLKLFYRCSIRNFATHVFPIWLRSRPSQFHILLQNFHIRYDLLSFVPLTSQPPLTTSTTWRTSEQFAMGRGEHCANGAAEG
jgi:hypothetical protein